MKRRYFDWEYVFAFVWENADRDGVWSGDSASLGAEFDVTEDEAHSMLSQLCDRHLIEKVYPGKYAISRWHERDEPTEEELAW